MMIIKMGTIEALAIMSLHAIVLAVSGLSLHRALPCSN